MKVLNLPAFLRIEVISTEPEGPEATNGTDEGGRTGGVD